MTTREQHLEFCKKCQNRQFNLHKGILCGLTMKVADFEQECGNFSLDKEVEHDLLLAEEFNKTKPEAVSAGVRFANRIIDILAVYVFFFVMGVLFPGIIQETFADESYIRDVLIDMLAFFVYYVFWESVSGRTVGKILTNTKVVTETGEKPAPEAILTRTLCRFIPFEVFSFFGPKAMGWHDSLSKTLVVKND